MENKPTCRVHKCGHKYWYLNGRLHREDGPAIEYTNGESHWVVHSKSHRLDGPAVILANGETKWFINDYNVTDKINKWAKENDIDLDNLSDVDKALIKIVWADYGK